VKTAYLFGSTGEIGTAISKKFKAEGYEVVHFSRTSDETDLVSITDIQNSLKSFNSADCVIWASGANLNDSILNFEEANLRDLLDANLFYITKSLDILIRKELLKSNCSLVIVSSVWQEHSKQNKLSYTISKSALSGLLHSLTADLSKMGIRVNAILPGVVDTAMTRKALQADQINNIEVQTPSGSLVTRENVANLTHFLSSDESQGINGQSITIDGGWSVVRYV
jgi:hypothetical protein